MGEEFEASIAQQVKKVLAEDFEEKGELFQFVELRGTADKGGIWFGGYIPCTRTKNS